MPKSVALGRFRGRASRPFVAKVAVSEKNCTIIDACLRWLFHGQTIYRHRIHRLWFRSCSAAIAREPLRDRERCLQPGRGEIGEDNFANGFEKLEVMPCFADPEHHDS